MKCRLPVGTLFEACTISEMAKLIEDDKPHGCIVPINPQGSGPPFFCVHGASGQVIGFYHLSKYLGPEQPFYGIQSIGWDRSAPPFTRTWDMAAHYVKEMRKIQPHGPYYLGGFSFGGRVAVYIANMLKQAGDEVALLAILDSSIGIGKHYVSCRRWLKRIDAPSGPKRVGLAIDYGLFRMRKAWDAAYDRFRRFGVFAVREFYRRLGWPVPLSMCRPDRLNALIRIEHQSMPVYEGDAVYLRTAIPKRSMAHPDTKDAWARVIKGNLETISIPGTHDGVIQEPNVRLVAEALKPRFANTAAANSHQRRNAGP